MKCLIEKVEATVSGGTSKEKLFLFSSTVTEKIKVVDPDETAHQSLDKVTGQIHTSMSGDLEDEVDVIDPYPPQGVSLSYLIQ